jgi:hypothetical protein
MTHEPENCFAPLLSNGKLEINPSNNIFKGGY